MQNSKEIKKKISSIKSIIKTTEAMKMISVSKIKKYKASLFNIREYVKQIESFLFDLYVIKNEKEKNKKIPFNRIFKIYKKKDIKNYGKILFILFTSDKGLCGSFNSLIFDKIKKEKKLHNKYVFFSFGKKGWNFLIKKNLPLYNHNQKNMNFFSKKEKKEFSIEIINKFLSGDISNVYLINHILKNSFEQEISFERILPISKKILDLEKKKPVNFIHYILDSSLKKTLNYLIPIFVENKIEKSFLESLSSEHTSRMITMYKASENAKNIEKKLLLKYNKERQYLITKEILEIISGLECLEEKK